MTPFAPIKILPLDIDRPLPDLKPGLDFEQKPYTRALASIRLHTHPLGMMEIAIPENGLTAAELAREIWSVLGEQIKGHLKQDGIVQDEPLDAAGLSPLASAPCQQERSALLHAPPFVSVVIATRNRVASLRATLQSVLALDYPRFDVYVVDNTPDSSETADFIHNEFANSPIKVHYLREDVPGLGNAHNCALRAVTAPIVAFTDDDVIVDADWLKSTVANFQRDPQVGCVTGMILPYELETQPQMWIEQYGGFSKGYKRITFDLKENRPQNFLFPYSAGRFGSGANMIFRTSVLKAIGCFDPALGAGTIAKSGDDLAAFFDVISLGYRLVYEPGAIVYHKHRRDYAGLVRQAQGYGVGMAAFLMKTIVDRPLRFFDILLKAPAGLRYLLDPRSSKNKKKQADYPAELSRQELKGYLIGPFLYLRSRWSSRRLKK